MSRSCVFIVLAVLCLPAQGAGSRAAHGYGAEVPIQQHPRVRAVFDSVRAVADQRGAYWPELVILVQDPGSPALAFPDGRIFLGLPSIRRLYNAGSRREGDARLAFLLGHELAHFSENDFQHLSGARGLTQRPLQTASPQGLRGLELRADQRGFIYAALAGYAVRSLLDSEGFLQTWVARYDQKQGDYAPARDRVSYLQQALDTLDQRLALYQFGIHLAQFGRCDDALTILNRFRRDFPAREVLYNIAACEMQLAQQAMPPSAAQAWWLPLHFDSSSLLDQASGAPIIVRSPAYGPRATLHLQRAEQALKQAVQHDQHYVPAWVLLASCQWLQQQVFAARASVEAALLQAPDDIDALGVKALILLREEREGAIELLQDVLVLDPDAWRWRYNLARILQADQQEAAKQHWQALGGHAHALPGRIYRSVCKQHSCLSRPPEAPAGLHRARRSGLPSLGQDVYENVPDKDAVFSEIIGEMEIMIYRQGQRWALALDGVVEMQREAIAVAPQKWARQHGLRDLPLWYRWNTLAIDSSKPDTTVVLQVF